MALIKNLVNIAKEGARTAMPTINSLVNLGKSLNRPPTIQQAKTAAASSLPTQNQISSGIASSNQAKITGSSTDFTGVPLPSVGNRTSTSAVPLITPKTATPAPVMVAQQPIRPPVVVNTANQTVGNYTASSLPSGLTPSGTPAVKTENASSTIYGPEVPSAPPQTTPTPTTPVGSTDVPSQRKALEDAYLASLSQSPEEIAAQQRLTDIQSRLAALRSSTEQGQNRITEQPIPMELLVGQGAALQRQALAQQNQITGESVPLEMQLAQAQARRELAASQAGKRLDFETSREQALAEKTKPTEVGGNIVRYNPVTGQYETIYSAPAKTEQFTLGENQYRYDNKGNLVASGPAKTTESSAPTSYREWQLAGSPGTYAGWVKKGENVGRPISAAQSQLLSEGANMGSVLAPIETLIKDQQALFGPVVGRAGAVNPYNIEAQTANAQLTAAAQMVGKYMEGGVLRQEDVPKYQKMLPQLSDTKEIASAKLENIRNMLAQKQQQYINDFESAGFDMSKFKGAESDISPDEMRQLREAFPDMSDEQIRQQGKTSDLSMSQNGSPEKIAMAIKQVESGGNYQARGASGESGAYQFMPSTWSSWARQYLGDSNAPMTPDNQDMVAIARIGDLQRQGYNAQQIALIWNGGQPVVKKGVNQYGVAYDSGAYANKVLSALG